MFGNSFVGPDEAAATSDNVGQIGSVLSLSIEGDSVCPLLFYVRRREKCHGVAIKRYFYGTRMLDACCSSISSSI
jgi:hypothetical protein